MCTLYLISQVHEVTPGNHKYHFIKCFDVNHRLHFYLTTEDSGPSTVRNASFGNLVSVKFVSEDGRLRDTKGPLSIVKQTCAPSVSSSLCLASQTWQ